MSPSLLPSIFSQLLSSLFSPTTAVASIPLSRKSISFRCGHGRSRVINEKFKCLRSYTLSSTKNYSHRSWRGSNTPGAQVLHQVGRQDVSYRLVTPIRCSPRQMPPTRVCSKRSAAAAAAAAAAPETTTADCRSPTTSNVSQKETDPTDRSVSQSVKRAVHFMQPAALWHDGSIGERPASSTRKC